MPDLFGRSYRVTVGDVEVNNLDTDDGDGLPVTFEIERTKAGLGAPNKADVAIYNLGESTRTRLADMAAGGWVNAVPAVAEKRSRAKVLPPGISVKVEAGWGGEVGCIFLGALREVDSEKVGPSWITTFGAADGEKELKLAKVRRSFAKGTPISVVLSALAGALGVKEGNSGSVFPRLGPQEWTTLQQAYHAIGPAAEELDYFIRSCGCEWSIQDGALQVMLHGSVADAPGRSSPVLSPDSGLIGQVKVSTAGIVSGKALLIPTLIPGRSFRVESTALTGNFRCIKTVHRGNSHQAGENWVVEFEGDSL